MNYRKPQKTIKKEPEISDKGAGGKILAEKEKKIPSGFVLITNNCADMKAIFCSKGFGFFGNH